MSGVCQGDEKERKRCYARVVLDESWLALMRDTGSDVKVCSDKIGFFLPTVYVNVVTFNSGPEWESWLGVPTML